MQAELLSAILPHVPFDGWSEPAFRQAVADLAIDPALARLVCPRGAVDLMVAYHRAADRAAEARIRAADWPEMKFRDKVAAAVRLRLEEVDPELVRRAASVFALPQHAATGSKMVWETADMIWRALGDSSTDYNWYSKRLILSGVFSSTVLYWLGDDSEGHQDSWAFLDRRVADVMQIEKVKGRVTALPGLRQILGSIRAPRPQPMPGSSLAPQHAPRPAHDISGQGTS